MRNLPLITKTRIWLAQHHPSAFLLGAQLGQLVLFAFFPSFSSKGTWINAISAFILVLVIWVISRSRTRTWLAWIFAIPALTLSVLATILENPRLMVWANGLEAVLYFVAAISLIIYMLNDTTVTTDELFAAGATFTLLAWGFADLYSLVQETVPGSFFMATSPGKHLEFVELLFLSFTNLSATGLGDILPISAPARVVAMLEQFSGVGYITIVVSRLVGLTTNLLRRKIELV